MPVEAKVSLPTRYEEPRQDRLKKGLANRLMSCDLNAITVQI